MGGHTQAAVTQIANEYEEDLQSYRSHIYKDSQDALDELMAMISDYTAAIANHARIESEPDMVLSMLVGIHRRQMNIERFLQTRFPKEWRDFLQDE